ncbi:hypothetical protein E2C01_098909 [Portunus trituberculatus]|uniref:Uncharacterized protein n=1 Tax=Portunus trituberculatus TaxID=210409 RepID=A0A5B7K866_PORTR|nr:hypothetical protein [Portunus trituberculatus]
MRRGRHCCANTHSTFTRGCHRLPSAYLPISVFACRRSQCPEVSPPRAFNLQCVARQRGTETAAAGPQSC